MTKMTKFRIPAALLDKVITIQATSVHSQVFFKIKALFVISMQQGTVLFHLLSPI